MTLRARLSNSGLFPHKWAAHNYDPLILFILFGARMKLIDVGTTTHFVVRYDQAIGSGAQTRAQAIVDTCERDLAKLALYMPYSQGGGGDPYIDDHRIAVEVVDLVKNRGGANNDSSGGTVHSFFTIRVGAINSSGGPITDDFARFLFVAELAEVLMIAYDWVPNDSRGEALSRVMAEELYPSRGYAEGGAPWVTGWLATNPRDFGFLGTPEPTDLNSLSYGIGILYINYLRSQLGFSLESICQAGGTQLVDAYRQLTGQPGADGVSDFRDLLERFYPSGAPFTILTNNPFPLSESRLRRLSVAVAQTRLPRPLGVLSEERAQVGRTAHLAPFFNCPARDYQYFVDRQPRQLDVVVSTEGFALPQFIWTINGTELSSAAADALTVDAPVTFDVPEDPVNPKQAVEPFAFSYSYSDEFSWQGLNHRLILRNSTQRGHDRLTLTVSVTDATGPTDATTATVTTIIDAASVVYEQAYYVDRARCAAKAIDSVESHNRGLARAIDIVRLLPDPPRPDVVTELLDALGTVRLAMDQGTVEPADAVDAARLLAGYLGVPDATLIQLLGVKARQG